MRYTRAMRIIAPSAALVAVVACTRAPQPRTPTTDGAAAQPAKLGTEGRYLHAVVELEDAILPARFAAALPSDGEGLATWPDGGSMGGKAAFPPQSYVEARLDGLDPEMLGRVARAIDAAPATDAEQVVAVYGEMLPEAGFVPKPEVCAALRAWLTPGAAHSAVFADKYSSCATPADRALVDSLHLPTEQLEGLYTTMGLPRPLAADETARVVELSAMAKPDETELSELYGLLERHLEAGDAAAVDVVLTHVGNFDTRVREYLRGQSAPLAQADSILIDIVDGMPEGPARTHLQTRCARAKVAPPICSASVLDHVGEDVTTPAELAERAEMRRRMYEEGRGGMCIGTPGGHDACRPTRELVSVSRELGLLGELRRQPSAGTTGQMTTFDFLEEQGQAVEVVAFPGAPITQLAPLVGTELHDPILVKSDLRHVDVETGAPVERFAIDLFAGGKRATLIVSGEARAEVEGAIALLNAALRANGSTWRLLTVEGSAHEVRVVAGPMDALDRAIDRDLLRPDRGGYVRAAR